MFLEQNEDGEQILRVSLKVTTPHKKDNIFTLSVRNNEAITFKTKVKRGDLIYVQAKPFSYPSGVDKGKWINGFKIQYYEVVKKQLLKDKKESK